METIIGLLFILLPLIFKLIGRKLEKAGEAAKAGQLKELAEMFGGEDDDPLTDAWQTETVPEPVQQPVREPAPLPVVPEPVKKPVRHTHVKQAPAKPSVKVKSEKPVLKENTVKKEKIDPKKLIVYSEIMTPKYGDY